MADLIHSVSIAAPSRAVNGIRPAQHVIAQASMFSHRPDIPGALRGGWFLNRLVCVLRGHRQLVATGAAKVLQSEARRDLFLCHACGAYSWGESVRNSPQSSWGNLAV